eukprot:15959641-Heterocapsa_arctica.AAC.1
MAIIGMFFQKGHFVSERTAISERTARAARCGCPRAHHRDRPDLRPAGLHGGLQVVAIESVVGEIGIFTSATGNFNIITLEHTKRMSCGADRLQLPPLPAGRHHASTD